MEVRFHALALAMIPVHHRFGAFVVLTKLQVVDAPALVLASPIMGVPIMLEDIVPAERASVEPRAVGSFAHLHGAGYSDRPLLCTARIAVATPAQAQVAAPVVVVSGILPWVLARVFAVSSRPIDDGIEGTTRTALASGVDVRDGGDGFLVHFRCDAATIDWERYSLPRRGVPCCKTHGDRLTESSMIRTRSVGRFRRTTGRPLRSWGSETYWLSQPISALWRRLVQFAMDSIATGVNRDRVKAENHVGNVAYLRWRWPETFSTMNDQAVVKRHRNPAPRRNVEGGPVKPAQ